MGSFAVTEDGGDDGGDVDEDAMLLDETKILDTDLPSLSFVFLLCFFDWVGADS